MGKVAKRHILSENCDRQLHTYILYYAPSAIVAPLPYPPPTHLANMTNCHVQMMTLNRDPDSGSQQRLSIGLVYAFPQHSAAHRHTTLHLT